MLGPPWRVIFGMWFSSSVGLPAWMPSAAADPWSAWRSDPQWGHRGTPTA